MVMAYKHALGVGGNVPHFRMHDLTIGRLLALVATATIADEIQNTLEFIQPLRSMLLVLVVLCLLRCLGI